MTIKQMLIWLCICPSAKFTSKSKKIAHIIFAAMIFTGHMGGTISHLAFFLKFRSTDLEGAVFSFMGAGAFSGILYVTMTVFLLRYQICAIFDELSIIYSARKYFFVEVTDFCVCVSICGCLFELQIRYF